jgi:hypothetical protein
MLLMGLYVLLSPTKKNGREASRELEVKPAEER